MNKTFYISIFFLIYSCSLLAADKVHNVIPPARNSLLSELDKRYPEAIGTQRELFLHDDELVAEKQGVQVVVGQAHKIMDQPVLKQDQSWELGTPRYINVIYDAEEQLYKMWYQCLAEIKPYAGKPGKKLKTGYAISRDGIKWEKPVMNHVQQSGKPTNFVFFGVQTKTDVRAPYMIKDYSDPNPGARYKALFHCWDFRGRGLGAAVSADGVHWQAPHAYTVMQGGYDTHNIFFWDPQHGCYVAYVRRWQSGKRYIARAISPDFYHWSRDITVLGPDEFDSPDENLYTPACFRLQHARNVYVMVTSVFDDKKDIVTPQMAVSRDGINWTRFRQPFIPFGAPGTWDSGGAWATATEIPYKNDELLFYYRGNRKAHGDDPDAGVGVATLKQDRFIGLYAEKEGTVTTHLMRLTHHGGRKADRGVFSLNADASNGQVVVELLDQDNKPIPGYTAKDCIPVKGDNTTHYVRWKKHANLYPVIGLPVRCRFYLKTASIYSFQVLRYDPDLSDNK